MPDWSPTIANDFIRMAREKGSALTQMQLQKLVYIAHGWNLAISGTPLTWDNPEAWEYGPVYRELRGAVREYGSRQITREIANGEYGVGAFSDDLEAPARSNLVCGERAVVERVFRDYGQFHAFQLSALTHQAGTPWSQVYRDGQGKFDTISPELIREHFIDLAGRQRPAVNA